MIHKSILIMMLLIFTLAYSQEYFLDKTHSTIMFNIKNYAQLGIPTLGRFNTFEGTLNIDHKDFTKSTAKIKIFTNSLDTGDKERDKHLLSQDFFNTNEYPTIEFHSSSITSLLKDNSQFILSGKLKILKTEKEISIYVKKEQEGKNFKNQDIIIYSSQFTINRSEFGMDKYIPLIDNKVDITVYLQFIKSQP
ncbi:MAG: YceI family protein [Candidatus Calescibacterium sp.]|nr:YceI family protein [Candidatus Calescibacterium sp.]MDW8132987.1 YceI family protein [Candidatus Calescibacterium sp.]